MVDSQPRSKSTKDVKRLATHMSRLGQVLSGRYELLELLGHGGMGAVYKARHLEMDSLVAVKMLLPDIADDPEMHKRFLREAKASGKINHPNVVQLLDFGEGPEGEAYIVIEYLNGIGLDELLNQSGVIGAAKAVHLFTQICDGVAKAHSKGIVHRDLKPSNVMLVEAEGEKDFVKVVDFGLAKALDPGEESQKLTNSGEIFGSPIYMSPEQCLGHQLDARSDIYALGVLMYECLTGKVPFLGAVVAETIARQMSDQPKPFAQMRPDLVLQIPESLEAVVMKALSKNPDERQFSMMELKEELVDALLPKRVKNKKQPTVLVTARPKTSSMEFSKKGLDGGDAVSRPSATAAPVAVSKGLIVAAVAGIVLLIGVGVFIGISLTQHPTPASSAKTTVAPTNVTASPPVSTTVPNVSTGVRPLVRKSVAPGVIPITKIDGKAKADLKPVGSGEHSSPLPRSKKEATKAKRDAVRIAREQKRTAKERDAYRARNSAVKTVTTAESQESSYHRKKSHDWHDYSYGLEKKDSYAHTWTPALPGSKDH